jgi:competence protein ComGC
MICLLLVALALGLAGSCVLGEAGAVESAFRAGCEAQLAGVYRALMAYRKAEGRLPADLGELVVRGMLTQAQLRCPSAARYGRSDEGFYMYDPSAWGTPNRVMVWEAADNHSMYRQGVVRRLIGRLPPAQYAVVSDGTVRNLAVSAGPM